MPRVIVTSEAAEDCAIDAPAGQSLMTALRDFGNGVVDEGFGMCGGCCSCYTCHVWIDEGCLGALAPASEQENDLLALTAERRNTSRLGCQITLTDALDGLRVTVPPAA